MHAWIAGMLAGLGFGKVEVCGGVWVVPLLRPGEDAGGTGTPKGPGYRSMPEAMARGELLVTEVSPAGEVGRVHVQNRGELPVLVLEGEEWSGGKQNRVVTTSAMLASGADVQVPVACSEPGRWHYHGAGMGPALGDSGAVAPVGLRRDMRMARRRGVAGELDADAVQAAAWRGLEGWRGRLGTGRTMAEWQGREACPWEGLEHRVGWIPGQVGWLVAAHGEWVALEVVSRPAAWRRLQGKMLGGVLTPWPWDRPLGTARPVNGQANPWARLDAMGRGEVGGEEWARRARAALRELANATGVARPATGEGQLEEHASADWSGAALMQAGEVLHAGWQRVRAAAVPGRVEPTGPVQETAGMVSALRNGLSGSGTRMEPSAC